MLSLLKRIFGGPTPLTPGQPSFDNKLIHFLSLPKRFAEGLPVDATQEQILALIERATAALAESTAFEPWGYEEDGKSILPLFTEQKHAHAFIQEYVKGVPRILPFQALQVEGRALLGFLDGYDEVVLDPKSSGAMLLRSRK